MKEEIDKILSETDEYVNAESINTAIKHGDGALHGRSIRYLIIAENSAAEDYYKKYGRQFDNPDSNPVQVTLAARILLYIMFALIVNLVLYAPVYFLAVHWAGVSSHDSYYVAVIVNTVIGMIVCGLWVERGTKRLAFKAGMRAEADDQLLTKYHIAKHKIDERYATKGRLPDFDFRWKD